VSASGKRQYGGRELGRKKEGSNAGGRTEGIKERFGRKQGENKSRKCSDETGGKEEMRETRNVERKGKSRVKKRKKEGI
jgi:hypothetical protein